MGEGSGIGDSSASFSLRSAGELSGGGRRGPPPVPFRGNTLSPLWGERLPPFGGRAFPPPHSGRRPPPSGEGGGRGGPANANPRAGRGVCIRARKWVWPVEAHPSCASASALLERGGRSGPFPLAVTHWLPPSGAGSWPSLLVRRWGVTRWGQAGGPHHARASRRRRSATCYTGYR